jgi:hypothetical protein
MQRDDARFSVRLGALQVLGPFLQGRSDTRLRLKQGERVIGSRDYCGGGCGIIRGDVKQRLFECGKRAVTI